MSTNRINFDDFRDGMRRAVLDAMDSYMRNQTDGCLGVKGWRDQDLAALFPAIDAHAARVAIRFNDPESEEPGSAYFTFAA
ncbi:hypothetical protein [Ralstonia syzygii]|uniref:Uncharacterized protein n=1 Tax=Ralstonia syzygii R24 TaxID=907261 RepID=G3A0E8_9RALS|nr:hypothetical protein [Ralstonia syzygii]CCA84645.1 hypothetical protein RALSY_10623 [Ralstonia syzygii R24]